MIKAGQLLREQRLKKKLTLEDIARDTKIKATFLGAIEKGEYHKLPSPAYAKGFVQNYASYLGLSPSEVVAVFRREFDEKKAYKVLPDSLTREFPLSRLRIRESLLFIGFLVFIFAGYLLFQYRAAFFAPPLGISSPKQDSTTSREVTVSGKTDSEATVTVNNEPVSVDSNGAFTKKLTLFPGKTEIVVRANNSFGKEAVLKREIVVK